VGRGAPAAAPSAWPTSCPAGGHLGNLDVDPSFAGHRSLARGGRHLRSTDRRLLHPDDVLAEVLRPGPETDSPGMEPRDGHRRLAMIPRTIHHVWPGSDNFRAELHGFRASFLRHHPDWSMHFWRTELGGEAFEEVRALLADPRYTVVAKSDVARFE